VTTLGCPKNQVDSDKIEGKLLADGLTQAASPEDADVVYVNTCAFIEPAREESVNVILATSAGAKAGARVVVTGCLAARSGDELAAAMPEVEIDTSVWTTPTIAVREHARKNLLDLPRSKPKAPWSYVKIAEGCNRNCGFCAIPSFRGPQVSRDVDAILTETQDLVDAGVKEIVLVAQDLASYGKDRTDLGAGAIHNLVAQVAEIADWTRLLYLYPSDLTDELIDIVGSSTKVPYFDLSLQHVSKPLLRRMRRWGDGDRFTKRISDIRARFPDAAFRTNFIVGYPGETEEDHDALLRFVETQELDWAGFFAFSNEPGTYAAELDGHIERSLINDRLDELTERQDAITAAKGVALIDTSMTVLVDGIGTARSTREAPEIDGVIEVPARLVPGQFVEVTITDANGPDLVATPTAGW
jgi:ribosomal protein S12 methylthiotransferase